MKGNDPKNKKRPHMAPLLLGLYAAYLGLGLVVIGVLELRAGGSCIRLVMGLGLTGLGLFGIWDGLRDLVRPRKQAEAAPARQWVLTDLSGNRHSYIPPSLLHGQLDALAEGTGPKQFYLQPLPPLAAGAQGSLRQVTCFYQDALLLVAFFEAPEGGYTALQTSAEPDRAEAWLNQLLAGSPDFSEWEAAVFHAAADSAKAETGQEDAPGEPEEAPCPEETAFEQDAAAYFLQQLAEQQRGQPAPQRKLLVIWGENWRDEHKFFSARDIGLAVEGLAEGKYQKVALEWGAQSFVLFSGDEEGLAVLWRVPPAGAGPARFLAKKGTPTQVRFWLVSDLAHGSLNPANGWADVTAQVEQQMRKAEKKHGNVF